MVIVANTIIHNVYPIGAKIFAICSFLFVDLFWGLEKCLVIAGLIFLG